MLFVQPTKFCCWRGLHEQRHAVDSCVAMTTMAAVDSKLNAECIATSGAKPVDFVQPSNASVNAATSEAKAVNYGQPSNASIATPVIGWSTTVCSRRRQSTS